MTILQLHNMYKYRGGEEVAAEAEKKMMELNGHHVISIITDNANIRNIFSERKKFYELLDKTIGNNKIDVAHIHNVYHIIGNRIYKYLADKGIPIVQTLHNFRFLCPAGTFMDNSRQICELCKNGKFRYSVKKKCYQNSYIKSFLMQGLVKQGRYEVSKYVRKFIALNPFSMNKFVEAGFDADKFVIKPNFLFSNSQDNIYTSHQNYALFIGRIFPEKGINILIEAFKELDFNLKIAGNGDPKLVAELMKEALENKNIEFLGYVEGDQKKDLLLNASFVIIPSLVYENFPMSILDAYSYGKAVIVSNKGGMPFIVKEGINGLLYSPNNPLELREAVIEIMKNNLYKKTGRNGYQNFIQNFTDKQNYIQLIKIYEEAITEKTLF